MKENNQNKKPIAPKHGDKKIGNFPVKKNDSGTHSGGPRRMPEMPKK